MTLEDDDVVIGMEIINEAFTGSTLFTVTENGFGKRTKLDRFNQQGRGGQGIVGSDAKEGDFVEELFLVSRRFVYYAGER